jgi:adenosylmethionine-8-amino-7-oxononanoate aminotransferase
VHGFTWSHNALGAAVALATLERLRDEDLVGRSEKLGATLRTELATALADVASVGDVRGLGMMIGIELVADRVTKEPFPRTAQVTERVVAVAREAGLLLYSSTGHADGVDGDLLMLGPPFVLTDEDAGTLVERTVAAIRAVS